MAKQYTFSWTLPDALFDADFSEETLSSRIREGVVLSLYREDRISAGLGAEMLGIGLAEFYQTLAEKGLPYFDFDESELRSELDAVDELSAMSKTG